MYSLRIVKMINNTLRLRQNVHHFPDDIFEVIFLNGNCCISIQIWLKLVPKGPISNKPTFFNIISHYLNQLWPSLQKPKCVTRSGWVSCFLQIKCPKQLLKNIERSKSHKYNSEVRISIYWSNLFVMDGTKIVHLIYCTIQPYIREFCYKEVSLASVEMKACMYNYIHI